MCGTFDVGAGLCSVLQDCISRGPWRIAVNMVLKQIMQKNGVKDGDDSCGSGQRPVVGASGSSGSSKYWVLLDKLSYY